MAWVKKGLIYNPTGKFGWDVNTVLTPTPVLLNDNVIRIYAGFRDEAGASRIGFIEVNADNPLEVLRVTEKPVLDLGEPGMFDDNGMLLGDIVRDGDDIRMYYVGFQLPKKAKFLAFSGLAISSDGGETFTRRSQVPVMDRTDNAKFIRAIHTAIKEDDKWRIWYSVGNGWQEINGLVYPQYDIRYTESADGIHFDDREGVHCVGNAANEYRIGRPRVTKRDDGTYEMRYTFDTLDKQYTAGYATSVDGIEWERKDDQLGISKSAEGWDSEMLCYPMLLKANDKKYLFYSGNGMGLTGVGYAEWAD